MIDNSVYWQNGTRFGPEWEKLDFTYSDFSGLGLFRDTNDGRMEIVTMMYSLIDKNANDIITFFHEPKGYKIKDFGQLRAYAMNGDIDGVSNAGFISKNNDTQCVLRDTYRYGSDLVQSWTRNTGFAKRQWFLIHAYVPVEKTN